MADINPRAELRVFNDRELFGVVTFPGDSATWALAPQVGKNGANLSGWCRDATGEKLIQQPVYIWQDCGPAQGTTAAGTLGAGTDETTGKLFTRCRTADPSDFTLTAVRAKDESFAFELMRVDSIATLYVYFSQGRTAGTEGLRLVVQGGTTLCLQASTDDAAWRTVASADLGAADTYLKSVGQRLFVDVMSQCDAAWDGLPPTKGAHSDAPPNRVVVSINGQDAVLTYAATALMGGALRVEATADRWDLSRVAVTRYATSCSGTLANVTRPDAVSGTGTALFRGWRPYRAVTGGGATSYTDLSGLTGTATVSGAGTNIIGLTMTLASPSGGIDGTGYAFRTVLLDAATADFPPIETAPASSPAYTSYTADSGLTAADWADTWDEGTRTSRGRGTATLVDTAGLFAPGAGGVLPAVKAFQLWMGDEADETLTLVATGYIGLDGERGFAWHESGGLTFVTLSLDDRLAIAARAIGYSPAMDGVNHFWAQGRYAKKMGVCNAHLPATITGAAKYNATDYHLPYGTAIDPVMQPQPADPVGDAMEDVRKHGGVTDAATSTVQPMILGFDNTGTLVYEGLPVGVIDAVQNQSRTIPSSLTPVQEFQVAPTINEDGTPKRDELLEETETVASLATIRSAAVFEGINIATGGIAVGWALTPALHTNPALIGYIGAVPSRFYDISRLVASQPIADRLAKQSDAQLTFPAVRTYLSGHLQPSFNSLTVFTVTNQATQGSTGAVAYYAIQSRHIWRIERKDEGLAFYGRTRVAGRLLGQAA